MVDQTSIRLQVCCYGFDRGTASLSRFFQDSTTRLCRENETIASITLNLVHYLW